MADGSTVATSALRVAAIRFLQENDGNVAESSRALKAFLRSKLPLVRRVSEEIADLAETVMESAAYAAVTKIQRERRAVIWRTPNRSGTTAGRRLVSTGVMIGQLDFPLRSGKRLGEATGIEVAEEASYYEGVGADAMAKAAWLRQIADAAGDRVVGEVLTEDDLAAFRE